MLSPVSNMASSRSEENVNLRHFPTQDGVTVLVSPYFAGLTNTVTPSCVGKCLRLTFSSDLEEAMFETGESLSEISKFNSVIEKNQPIYMKN